MPYIDFSDGVTRWYATDAERAQGFDKLELAAAGLAAGEHSIVNEYDPDAVHLATLWQQTPGAAVDAYDVCTDGRRVYYAVLNSSGANVFALDRSTGQVVWSQELNNGCSAICCDGEALWVAEDLASGIIHKLDPATGEDYGGGWIKYTHGAAVVTLAVGRGGLFLGGASGSGSKTHRCLNPTTGAEVWVGDHGATVNALLPDRSPLQGGGEERLYLVGEDSTDVGLRVLDGITGDPHSMTPNTFDHGADLYAIAQSRDHLFVGGQDGGTGERLRCLSKVNLTEVWSEDAAEDVTALAFSGEYLYLGIATDGTDRAVRGVDPRTGSAGERYAQSAQIVMTSGMVRGLATDGFALFAATSNSTGFDYSMHRFSIPARPQIVVRHAGNEPYRWPWPHLITPTGRWEF